MEERKAEERFEVAVRYLCERWGCFDFKQRNPGRFFSSVDESVLDDRVRLLKSDIDRLGAVTTIKRRLGVEPKDDVSLELAAHNRLDLTVESLALRPAWNSLFDEPERRTAAERLLRLISFASPSEMNPLPGEDLSRTVDWVNDQIISWETDPALPNSKVPYGPVWRVEPTVQTWCESVADSARAFAEIGLIRTSLKQSDHYFGCSKCAQAWPRLYKPFRQFQQTTINTCCDVLKVLRVCLDRARKERTGGAVGEGDQFAWRAIVCAAGASYNLSVREVEHALTAIESGHVFEPTLHSALSGFDPQDIHALSLIEAASAPFIELQWDLYDDDDLIYLPSDGDLSEIPGVVTILNSTQVADWKRLMTGSDLAFEKRSRAGGQCTYPVDGDSLLYVLEWAAAFRTQKPRTALASTTEKIRQRAHELWAERTSSGVHGSAEEDWACAEREVLSEDNRPTPQAEPPVSARPNSASEAAIQSLSDRMTGLSDVIESNSALQVPIIDNLQDIVKKIDGHSRGEAQRTIREDLGVVVYEWLCPLARNAAISAEYCLLDPNFPNPSTIVTLLATAFEHQLRMSMFEPFCKYLKDAGTQDYPEPPGVPPRSSSNSAPDSLTRPGLPVPVDGKDKLPQLLKRGRMTDRLNLGAMEKLLKRPLTKFDDFLKQQRIDLERLRKILHEITEKRNDAVHKGSPSRIEEVSDIRRQWIGQRDGSPNIFAAIMPGELRPTSS